MTYRILADENVDHRVVARLRNYGHDVEHVDSVEALGKGARDPAVADHGLGTDRLLLTNDDFLRNFDDTERPGTLFVDDDSLSSSTVSDVVHEISLAVPQAEIDGVVYVSRNWL